MSEKDSERVLAAKNAKGAKKEIARSPAKVGEEEVNLFGNG
jgi:hypothetical protein